MKGVACTKDMFSLERKAPRGRPRKRWWVNKKVDLK